MAIFGGGFIIPKVYITNPIILGPTVTEVYITVYYSGSITFRISANGGTNWESVTLVSGVRKIHTFTNSGNELKFMAIGNQGSKITAQMKTNLSYDKPALNIEITGAS